LDCLGLSKRSEVPIFPACGWNMGQGVQGKLLCSTKAKCLTAVVIDEIGKHTRRGWRPAGWVPCARAYSAGLS
jgi:hypothetical protein